MSAAPDRKSLFGQSPHLRSLFSHQNYRCRDADAINVPDWRLYRRFPGGSSLAKGGRNIASKLRWLTMRPWGRPMSRAELKNTLKHFILEQFLLGEAPEALTDDVRLISDGIIDSLGSLRLVAFIEEKFGVLIEAHEIDADHLDLIDNIVDLIASRTA
jgi:acyl carrier protein